MCVLQLSGGGRDVFWDLGELQVGAVHHVGLTATLSRTHRVTVTLIIQTRVLGAWGTHTHTRTNTHAHRGTHIRSVVQCFPLLVFTPPQAGSSSPQGLSPPPLERPCPGVPPCQTQRGRGGGGGGGREGEQRRGKIWLGMGGGLT